MKDGLALPAVMVTLFFFSMGGHPYASAAVPSEGAREAFQNAVRLREQGKLLEAERQLVKALGQNPAHAYYQFELANLYAARHDRYRETELKEKAQRMLEKTARALEQAAMLDPEFLPAQYNLAVAYKRLGRYETARERFRQIMEKNPNADPEQDYTRRNCLMQIGATYEEQGFFDEAADTYRRAKELDFHNPSIESAIREADQKKKEGVQEKPDDRSFPTFGRFPQVPDDFYSNALWRREMREREDSAGLGQALPYLGAMLYEQFMKFRNRSDDDYQEME